MLYDKSLQFQRPDVRGRGQVLSAGSERTEPETVGWGGGRDRDHSSPPGPRRSMEDSSRLPSFWSHLVIPYPWEERHGCRCTGRHTWCDRQSGLRL